MPFLLVTGHPSSGKSTIVDRLVKFLREEQNKYDVIVVRDDEYANFSRTNYNCANKEKELRSHLRSCVQKELSKPSIVICDGLNYIKGFRYELFLVGKLAKTTYAVLEVKGSEATCQWLNQHNCPQNKYEASVIGDLLMRYESPDSRQRWDSPLFSVQTGKLEREQGATETEDLTVDLDHLSPRFVHLPLSEIRDWLCEGTALVENASTAIAPLAPADLLHLLDKVTQEVVSRILEDQKMGLQGRIIIPSAEDGANELKCSRIRSIGELSRLRRQFISFTKTNPVHNPRRIASLFINFLNSSP